MGVTYWWRLWDWIQTGMWAVPHALMLAQLRALAINLDRRHRNDMTQLIT
jgi:hypothetical protein